MQSGARRMAYVGYGAMVALTAVMGWLLYGAANDSREAARGVDHTLDALGRLGEISESLGRAESAHRGYLLYGKELLLGERDRALKQAGYALERIREARTDNAAQLRRIAALERLMADFEAGLHAGAEDKRVAITQGQREARPNLESQDLTDHLYELIFEMKGQEFRLLELRRAEQAARDEFELKLLAAVAALLVLVIVPSYVGFFRASRATRRAEFRMGELAESLPGAVFQLREPPDGTGRYEYLSASAAAVLGVDRDAALKDPNVIRHSVMESDFPGLIAARAAAEESMKPLVYDYRAAEGGGAIRWIRISAAPVREPDGSLLWSGHWGDVTAQKRMEQELRESQEAAVAASRAKSTFLATMSHEIRTPMNGVIGMLELLSLGNLDGEQRTTLEIVRESGRSLLRIIDDILDFSRIEAGRLELRAEPTLVVDVVERVVNIYAGNASSKGLVLKRSVDARLGETVRVDPLRLQQILNNFVSNAIKFTLRGEVTLAAELLERRDGRDAVRFTVRDTGIGISAADQKRLFQPFSQASEETTSRYGGSGLGLSICRRLAELMGGSVEMHSEVGTGTTMVLNLTLPVVEAAIRSAAELPGAVKSRIVRRAPPTVAQAEEDGTLILMVDDHPINRMVLLKQLNILGYAAVAAEDGVEALALWSGGRFGAVVTDCNMPEMNGYDFARGVRAREARNGGGRVPIIACTANALEGEAQHCFEAGMDDYLAKPIELSRLAEKLERWLPLAKAPGREVETSASETAAGSPIDAAILDEIAAGDDDLAREVLERFHRHNQEDVAHLLDGIERVDSLAVVFASHRIKGSSRTVGASALAEVCERLERAGNANDWTAIAGNLDALHRETARLDAYIESQSRPATL
jgi:signal transduction histidine kinase/CHASE3 domain sensor protein/DNA-binding NarL/FixJ family response regulator